MSILHLEFERVVREFCEFLGVAGWEQVARNQHLEVDGTTVGLIHDELQTANALCLYFDMGSMPDDPAFPTRLLVANAAPGPCTAGYFAVHPDAGRIAWCAKVQLAPELSGQELGSLMFAALARAREELESIRHGHHAFPA